MVGSQSSLVGMAVVVDRLGFPVLRSLLPPSIVQELFAEFIFPPVTDEGKYCRNQERKSRN